MPGFELGDLSFEVVDDTVDLLDHRLGDNFHFDADLNGKLDLIAVNGHIDETVRNIRSNAGYAQPPHLFLNDGRGGFVQFLDPRTMNGAAWRDVALMRYGPWAFQIVGLYVWLVPCLIALRFAGWRPLLAVSWSLYLWYRIAPHPLTTAQFETVFPILAWQLLFVHGVAIGYHRERVSAFVARCPKVVPLVVAGTSAAFIVFSLCNPWTEGPRLLRWGLVSPEHFTHLYFNYFTLTDLRIGRVLNLAVALPMGYALLTWCWRFARPLGIVFVTLGQQSLGAFVLHVYGILLIANMPLAKGLWTNTLAQVTLIIAIAALLNGAQRLPLHRSSMTAAPARPLAA